MVISHLTTMNILRTKVMLITVANIWSDQYVERNRI